MSRLTIISHTEHYKKANGSLLGLGPTVTELNALLAIFDTITHVAMLHDTEAPPSALPYVSDRIKFVALPAVGGPRFSDKIRLITASLGVIRTVRTALKTADYFQFRAPTGIGVYVLPYLLFFASQKGWFKYAGNWKQTQAPLAYRFQKWLLEKQRCPVTINGFWPDQPSHCLSFENPCLTADDLAEGQAVQKAKTRNYPLDLCFVGRLEAAKGVDLLLETLGGLDVATRQKLGNIHLVGAGVGLAAYQAQAEALGLSVIFHGFLSRSAVHGIYKRSHAIVLPSASEGFPKVIAEALNFGCIPVVSDVSSISHYVKDGQTGFLIKRLDTASLASCLKRVLDLESVGYKELKGVTEAELARFTYDFYNKRLEQDILSSF
ncbi:glycosyltransferase [Winogradskyella rapida]|uniref:Glycosyltransferase n=1 Tax=Winogradskyella rapida TaxID=549701 RepID=A0ABW3KLS8_9FLAO